MQKPTKAQQQTPLSIDWKIGAELPAIQDHQKALGLAGPVVGISEDKLIVGGGANFPDSMPWLGGKKKYYDEIYVFEKDEKGNIQLYPKTFHLPQTLAYPANVSTLEGIISAGGENQNGISKKTFLLKWDKDNQTMVVQPLPELPLALSNAAITAGESIIYLAGGETENGVSNKFYRLNLKDISSGWTELPDLQKPVSHSVMVMQSDKIYLIGGRRRNPNGISDLYASVFCYDLKKEKWSKKHPLPYALSAGTGLAIDKQSILIFGGDKGATFHKTEELIAEIKKEINDSVKQQLINRKANLQASHPGFSKEVLKYDVCENTWKPVGIIPFSTPATTTAVQWKDEIVIPSGEIKAGVRTPALLVGKIIEVN